MTKTEAEIEAAVDTADMNAALADITVACEQAYRYASLEGLVDNPTVIAAVAALKTAHAALVLANDNFNASKDNFFRAAAATWRSDRALRAARAAYVRLRAVILQADQENAAKI